MRVIIRVAMIVVGLLLILDIAYFARGSLELFPTDEQVSKVRAVTAVGGALLLLAELLLWALLRHLKKHPIAPDLPRHGVSPPHA